jgi:hypothetical protein
VTGCLSSRISGIVRSQRFEAQAVAKDSRLLFDGIFVDARDSVLRHGAHPRNDASLISERIVVAPCHFHHRAQGKCSSQECKYKLAGCVPP